MIKHIVWALLSSLALPVTPKSVNAHSIKLTKSECIFMSPVAEDRSFSQTLPTTKPAPPAGPGRTSSPTPSGPNPSTHPHMPSLTTMSPAKVPGALISPLATYQVLLLTHDSPTELDCLSPAKQNHTKALCYLPDWIGNSFTSAVFSQHLLGFQWVIKYTGKIAPSIQPCSLLGPWLSIGETQLTRLKPSPPHLGGPEEARLSIRTPGLESYFSYKLTGWP